MGGWPSRLYAWPSRLYGGGPCDYCVSPSPFDLDFGTLDFGTLDSGLTISLEVGELMGTLGMLLLVGLLVQVGLGLNNA